MWKNYFSCNFTYELFFFSFNSTSNEIFALLSEPITSDSEEDDDTIDVIFEPDKETAFAQSDEDSDLSDAEATQDINHLPSRILRSAGVFQGCNNPKTSDNGSNNQIGKKPSTRKKKKDRHWDKKSAEVALNFPASPDDATTPSEVSPLACFEKVFPMSLVEHIVEQTNIYSQLHGRDVKVSSEEILGIIGLMIYSGFKPVHDKQLMWCGDDDVSLKWAKDLMPKNRFKAILRDLHLADNSSLNSDDPYYKVRPFFERLNKSFLESLPLDQNICVDEVMVPYYGRHGTKQFIRGKPVRYGYKIWALASSKGYMYQVEPYCGAMTNLETTGYGQGYDVVLGLLNKSNVPSGKCIYFDNLFTSLSLLDELTNKGIGGCGTMRENRLGGVPITSKKAFEKLPRGTCEHMSDSKNLIVRWNDNKAVTTCTNFVPLEPKSEGRRYVKKQGGHITVEIPGPIHAYNKNMGGVDLFDQCLSNYRSSIRTKKWW